MKEAKGNIWSMEADAICITTNSNIRKDGKAVMGKGIAKEAADRFPEVPELLAASLKLFRPHVHVILSGKNFPDIVVFPTKYNWWEPSPIRLITTSTEELVELAEYMPQWKTILIPRPGCGNGGLNWENEVKPILTKYLDDHFIIVSK